MVMKMMMMIFYNRDWDSKKIEFKKIMEFIFKEIPFR
jgi:hypothetical protein